MLSIYTSVTKNVTIFKDSNPITLCPTIVPDAIFLMPWQSVILSTYVLNRSIIVLSSGIHFIICFGMLSSDILSTFPYQYSLSPPLPPLTLSRTHTLVINLECLEI